LQGPDGGETVRGWEVPDTGLSGAQVRAARHVVETELRGVQLALIGGSLAVGLGNTTSDVNVYVISEPPSHQVFDHNGIQITVTALDPAAVRAVVQSLPTIDTTQLALIVQLVYGHRLQATTEWAAIVDRLDVGAARKLAVMHHATEFAALTADSFGALRSGDWFTAVTASRLALLASAEAALAATGDLYNGPKHLFRRLARTEITADWCVPLWNLADCAFEPGSAGPALVREIVESRQLTGNLLLAWCMTEGWDEPLKSLPAPYATPSRGPRRNPYFVALRPGGEWELAGPRHSYVVSEAVIRLWRRLDGQDLDQLARVLADEEPSVAGVRMDQLEAVVGTLHRIGAVDYAPHRPGDRQLAEAGDGPVEATYDVFSIGRAHR
jgi:hypothetical protein